MRTCQHLYRIFFCICFAVAAILPTSKSVAADIDNDNIKTLLILNSYDEYELWGNDMAEPIATYLSTIDSVGCDIVNLNNGIVSDSTIYNSMVDNLFQQYEEHKPSYVVMVGNFAFTLRDRIEAEWGDVPILLITRVKTYAPVEMNFTNHDEPVNIQDCKPLENIRYDYNFTTIHVPDFCEETVDLMAHMIPEMQELVFFSTNILGERILAQNITDKLAKDYPSVKFIWIKASGETSTVLHEYLTKKHPKTGMLLSTWVYRRTSLTGIPALTASGARLIMSSKNPVFSLREPYRAYGTIGGVFSDANYVHQQIISLVDSMLAGVDMREVPFVSAASTKMTSINYRLLNAYGLQEANCPADTQFLVKPPSFWEQYKWLAITTILVFVFIVIIFTIIGVSLQMKAKRTKYNQFFISNMPVPFTQANIQFDKKGKVSNVLYTIKNLAFEQLIENNKQDGNPFLLFPADFISEKVSLMMRQKKPVSFNYHFEKTDSYYDFIICSVMEKAEKYGSLSVCDIFATDVTKRFRMEKQIRRSAEKLDMALTVARIVPVSWNIATDILIYDDRGTLNHNQPAVLNNGDHEDGREISFDDFMALTADEDRERMAKLRRDLKAGVVEGVKNMVVRMRGLSSDPEEYNWFEINNIVTQRTPDNKPLVVTGSLHNITERKKMEQLLLESLDKAKESDRMKSIFLSNMSHEIRTPLNAIIGFSNLLADTTDEAERKEFVDIINLNNSVLLSLVNDVLDIAKIEANTMEMRYVVTDVNDVIDAAEKTVRFRVPQGVTLNVHHGMDKCIIEAAAVRISQILGNFLTNACKFTLEGTIDLGYELRDGKQLYFYVRDTGIGISKENQQVIFDRFVKLNDFAQGTGLGLAICSRLVELLGGEIGVDSEGEGKGSTFWFTLPYKPCDDAAVAEYEGTNSDKVIPINSNVTYHPTNAGKPLMMVAEDNLSNFKLITHMLRDEYVLVRAVNGIEAVEIFKQRNPDIILMDIGLPIMDGYEATKRIREISATVPIIAVTAYSYDSDRRRILSSGFNAFVSKPVTSSDLMEAISKVTHQTMRKGSF